MSSAVTDAEGVAAPALAARPAALPLYLAFAGTGIGVALPGAILPTLLLRWHLSDEQAGRLFLMAWIGSSLGALLVRGSLCRLLLLGTVAFSAACTVLALCGPSAAYAGMLVYGVGLGLVMTSISLIRRQHAARSGAEMIRLNLVWAAGACLCPSLTVQALAHGAVTPLLVALAAASLLFAAWVAIQTEVQLLPVCRSAGERIRWFHAIRSVPFALIAMLFLITGVEASAGGWLTTWFRRGGHTVAGTIAASTVFWGGLLLSRLFWSAGDRWIARVLSQRTIVQGSIALMVLASALLFASPSTALILPAAFALGVGIGPTYPLLLAWALDHERDGTIFFLAGVGSAFLPWLTGLVSTQHASLRTGLVVPAVGTLLLLALSVACPLACWSRETRA